jgi:hypothetical protein
MTESTFQKDPIAKRTWGRLLWVAVTNLLVLAFSIYVLMGTYRDDVRINRDNPPPPSFGDVIYDNPAYAVACVVAGLGLLLEATRRREAAFLNCGMWLAFSIYAIAQNQPTPSKAVAMGIFAVSFVWYAAPGKARFIRSG